MNYRKLYEAPLALVVCGLLGCLSTKCKNAEWQQRQEDGHVSDQGGESSAPLLVIIVMGLISVAFTSLWVEVPMDLRRSYRPYARYDSYHDTCSHHNSSRQPYRAYRENFEDDHGWALSPPDARPKTTATTSTMFLMPIRPNTATLQISGLLMKKRRMSFPMPLTLRDDPSFLMWRACAHVPPTHENSPLIMRPSSIASHHSLSLLLLTSSGAQADAPPFVARRSLFTIRHSPCPTSRTPHPASGLLYPAYLSSL